MYYRIISKLNKFAAGHSNLYVYGAGKYGKRAVYVLQELNYHIRAFIVTEKAPMHDEMDETSIIDMKEAVSVLGASDGVLLAMKPKFQEEVQERMVACRADILPLSEDDLFVLSNWDHLRYFSELSRLNPACRFTRLQDYKNILIVRLDVIGDMIWTTPFIRELRREVPNAHLTLVLRRDVYDLMKNCPYLDEIICYDLPGNELACQDLPRLERRARNFAMKNLVDKKFDIVFLPRFLHFSDCFENVMLAVFCGAKTRVGRVEYKAMGMAGRFAAYIYKPMFSILSEEHEEKHESQRILQMLTACGVSLKNKYMELWPDQKAKDFADKLLGNYTGKWIALGLVGREAYRCWKVEYYVEFICSMKKRHGGMVKFILLGGSDALSYANFLHAIDGCLDLVGKTTLDVATAVLDRCSLYVGSNTGIMHMAAAMHVPVVEISPHLRSSVYESGISPLLVGAIGIPHTVLQPERGADEKCEQAGHCIRKEPHCILQVKPSAVANAANKLLMMN